MTPQPKANGAGSVIADIEKRLKRIKVKDYVTPGAQVREHDVVVCPADTYMKRLFTLRAQVGHELERLAHEGVELSNMFKVDSDGLTMSRFIRKVAENTTIAATYTEKAAALQENSVRFGETHSFFELLEALCEVELSKRAPRNYEGGYVTIDSNWNIVRTQVHPLGKKHEPRRKVVGVLYEA